MFYEDLPILEAFSGMACIIGILASGLPAYAAASPAQATPESVISLINQIGTVTRSRRPAIVAALNAYNQLDDASKAQVSNFSVLADAQQILGIQDALAKLSVSYDKVDADWSISTPYVERASTGKVPVSIRGSMFRKTPRIFHECHVPIHWFPQDRFETDPRSCRYEKYTFDCDTSYDGGYDASLRRGSISKPLPWSRMKFPGSANGSASLK